MGKIKMPYTECPGFNNCSAPKCPLDSEINDRIKLQGDEKCKAHKPTRKKIGEKYPEILPYKGLTKREYIGGQIWDSKTDEEKKKITEQGVKSLKTIISGGFGRV